MALARAPRRSSLPRERARVLPPLERRYARVVADYFRGMLARIEPGIRRVAERRTKADPSLTTAIEIELGTIAWDQETRILSRAVRPVLVTIAEDGAEAVARELGIEASFGISDRGVEEVVGDVGSRIRRVSDVSRERVAREIAEGVEKGLSVEQIVRGVPEGTTSVRGPVPAFRGIRGLVDSWSSTGAPGFAGAVGSVPLRSSRAYLIALTESGNAFNRSAIESYRASGLVDFVEVFDGPDCGWTSHDDPDLAHGSIRTLEAAKAHPLAHPRCQRAFGAAVLATGARPSPFARGEPVPGATPGVAAGGPTAAVARDTIGFARGVEPGISRTLGRSVDGRTIAYQDALRGLRAPAGGDLAGFENRLKTAGSMTRKLDAEIAEARAAGQAIDAVEAARRDARDAVRYTYRFNESEYGAGSLRVASDLYQAGYRPTAWKDTWDSPVYRGINSNWTTPTGERFEVQFHTPGSFATKERNHTEYEEARDVRTSPTRRRELEDAMAARTRRLRAPSGRLDGGLLELLARLAG